MTPIVYVAGKYRHYKEDGELDTDAMADELADEQFWAEVVADCGLAWIAPLSNSVFLEDTSALDPDEYVQRDLCILRRLRPGYDIVLMREGWDEEPESTGARAEFELATKLGLIVAYTMHGEDNVSYYLESRLHAAA